MNFVIFAVKSFIYNNNTNAIKCNIMKYIEILQKIILQIIAICDKLLSRKENTI